MRIFSFFLVLIFAFLLAGALLFSSAFEIKDNQITVKDESKPLLKALARKMNRIIYDKATEYNPEGDVLPDQIDDNIKEKIKRELE